MSWFIAKIVFNLVTAHAPSKFEEQLRLIEADSCEEAFFKAKAIGINEEGTLVEGDNQIKWEYVDIADLFPLHSLGNGSEICSQTRETDAAHDYIRHVHERGMAIRLNA
jgi:Domain of unknown function (DUF4288)